MEYLSSYSIKDLETLSGIKAHTLRIWEQRYGVIIPKRTDTNIRYYTDEDLKLILNISLLNKNGYKISKIALLSQNEIKDLVSVITTNASQYPEHVQSMVVCMLEIDEEKFESILKNCVRLFGIESTVIKIIYPFLNKVGLLWQMGTIGPYQEHFVSNLIRQKIIVAIDSIENNFQNDATKFILYLPENELHEIGLLLGYYILKVRGFRVYYFGQTLPYKEFSEACRICKPDYTFTVITTSSSIECKSLIEKKASSYASIKHIFTGNQMPLNFSLPENVIIAEDAYSFIEFLNKLKKTDQTIN